MMRFLPILLLILLVSCNSQYTTPLCTEANKTDLPNLENSYFEQNNSKFSVERVEFGKYKIPGKGIFKACLIGTTIYAEFSTKTKKFVSYKLLVGADKKSISVTALKFDTEALDKLEIPYKTSKNMFQEVIIADNAQASRSSFTKALKNSITITIKKHK